MEKDDRPCWLRAEGGTWAANAVARSTGRCWWAPCHATLVRYQPRKPTASPGGHAPREAGDHRGPTSPGAGCLWRKQDGLTEADPWTGTSFQPRPAQVRALPPREDAAWGAGGGPLPPSPNLSSAATRGREMGGWPVLTRPYTGSASEPPDRRKPLKPRGGPFLRQASEQRSLSTGNPASTQQAGARASARDRQTGERKATTGSPSQAGREKMAAPFTEDDSCAAPAG